MIDMKNIPKPVVVVVHTCDVKSESLRCASPELQAFTGSLSTIQY